MEKDKILEALKAAEMLDAKGIMAATELERPAVDKAIKALRKDGLVDSPKRCFYAIAEGAK